ncbi:molybdopterin-binding protein [Pontivivens nitratireducens]|uniref:Molybdopterin molybdenumtransferase n=1 Tax=Pontivivens nitratireducens TaxID=2758038 RepID=A0A6G7VKA5_9RHOB|nr:molybdopterin-binding protein [Pontibrevibacter nitratireducens]QIK40372.1 molybdopterin molybdenumtransferase MoeA [Pontibrevibacter nitratireducens]
MMFDSVVAVDWSARSTPSLAGPCRDAIWIGRTCDGVDEAPLYCRTRAEAMAQLLRMVERDRAAGRRVLIGFDFAFGWPQGFAAAVTGQARALAVWDHLAARIVDAADNANNRYDVAEALNAGLSHGGPFWAKSHRDRWAAIPYADTRTDHGLPERRMVERRAKGTKPVWQLAGAGSVGSQSLLGVARLHALRKAIGAQVWPFDTDGAVPDGDVVLAEIYPGLFREQIAASGESDEIPDRAQVRVTAAHLAGLGRIGVLAELMDIRALGDVITQEEGWILGVPVTGTAPRLRNDCFALPPGVHWTPVATALERLRGSLTTVVGTETVALRSAGGRVLAQDAVARRSNPSVANAAVDGYAFAWRAAEGDATITLPLTPGRAAAGVPFAGVVPPDSALRILTGAAVPEACDTVIMEEDTSRTGNTISFESGLRPGANVRQSAEDFAQGSVLLPAGHRLRAPDLALLAAGGPGQVAVRRKLRVAVLSTGDELSDRWQPGDATLPDANRPMLIDLLQRWNMEAVDLGIAGDCREDVRAALDAGAAQADAVLTTGGASAGDEDHVSATLRAANALQTWRIAIKPGRPLALGVWGGVPVFGLPGNPVAALVCAVIFVRPALLTLAGADWPVLTGTTLPAAFTKRKKAGRREFLRARVREGRVEVYPSEGSGRIAGLSWAEGLCELPDGAFDISPGTPVTYHAWSSFGI